MRKISSLLFALLLVSTLLVPARVLNGLARHHSPDGVTTMTPTLGAMPRGGGRTGRSGSELIILIGGATSTISIIGGPPSGGGKK